MKKFLVSSICLWSIPAMLIYGCATLTPAIQTGLTALQIIDSFYDFVVAQKAVPATLQAATIILQQADIIAAKAKDKLSTPELIAQAKMLNDQANKL